MKTQQHSERQQKKIAAIAGVIIVVSSGMLLGYELTKTKVMKNTKPRLIDLKQSEVPTTTEAATSTLIPQRIIRALSITPSTIWKIYTTTNFTLQYPANWFVDEYTAYNTKDKFAMEIADVPHVTRVYGSPLPHSNQDIQVFYYATGNMPTEINDPYRKINTAKPTNINGYQGLRVNTSGEQNRPIDEIELADPKGGYIVIRQYIGDTDIFSRIVATVKFTD